MLKEKGKDKILRKIERSRNFNISFKNKLLFFPEYGHMESKTEFICIVIELNG